MFTTSTLLAIASGAIRLGLTYAFWKSFGWLVTLPPAVAGLLLGLAALPDLLKRKRTLGLLHNPWTVTVLALAHFALSGGTNYDKNYIQRKSVQLPNLLQLDGLRAT